MAQINGETHGGGLFTSGWNKYKGSPEKLRWKIVDVARKAKNIAKEDPRRVIHSFKVALAITLVSLFYYFEPLYEGFGVAAMWAVLTVVVVFEFSVGATLGKGVNRGLATFLGGALGVGAHRLASFSGERLEPVLLGASVFLIAAIVTFTRFFPRMKARYDYGLLIFILTFSLITVSGYRDDELLEMAHQRLSTILIGGSTTLLICVFICPVWSGHDLHNLIASNMEKNANFLGAFGGAYFKKSDEKSKADKATMQGYKSVLNSKSSEETLANFAKWEPRHGRFRYRHPWGQYLKIGALTRQCAYRIEALNGYLSSEIQTPRDIRAKIQEPCTKISSESSLALKEVALSIRTMSRPTTANSHIATMKTASVNLKSMLKTNLWKENDLLQIIPAATIASLLLDVVTCIEKIDESVNELASLARFKKEDATKPTAQARVVPCNENEEPQHVICVE